MSCDDGVDIQFRASPATLLHKVFCAFAAKRSMKLQDVVFVFEGTRLRPDRTVQEYGIEDGDVIDLMVLQVGD